MSKKSPIKVMTTKNIEQSEANTPFYVSLKDGDPLDKPGLFLASEHDGGENVPLPESYVMLAKNAERPFISLAASLCAELIERINTEENFKYQQRQALEWLVPILNEIGDNVAPDEAFLWKVKGQKGPRLTLIQLLQLAKLKLDVDREKESHPDKPIDAILFAISEREGVSHDTMWARYKKAKQTIGNEEE